MQQKSAVISAAIVVAGLLVVSTVHDARANVTVGVTDGGGVCTPLACFAAIGGTVYQQIYAASAFQGQITFNGVRFLAARTPFDSGNESIDTATYTVSFFLSSAAPSQRLTPGPGTLSTILGDNAGPTLGILGTFSLGGLMPDNLDLIGAPIDYDPADGNLLMQIVVDSIDGPVFRPGWPLARPGYFQSDIRGTNVSAAYQIAGFSSLDDVAVVTTFLAVPTPEPGTAALLGLAIAGLAGMRHRQR